MSKAKSWLIPQNDGKLGDGGSYCFTNMKESFVQMDMIIIHNLYYMDIPYYKMNYISYIYLDLHLALFSAHSSFRLDLRLF